MAEGIGERIRLYRRRRGISQRNLAELVGRSESWLSHVERGLLAVENLGVLIRLADMLRVDVRTLTGSPFYLAPDGGVELQEVEAVRTALAKYTEIEAMLNPNRSAPPRRGLDELAADVDAAWRLRQASRYGDLCRCLPNLLGVGFIDADGRAGGVAQR